MTTAHDLEQRRRHGQNLDRLLWGAGRDGAVIYHHPVSHGDGSGRWTMWCEDCTWTSRGRGREQWQSDWYWHLWGELR